MTLVETPDLSRSDCSPPTVALGRVAVVGLGYVGLPTALAFAAAGAEAEGIDINQARLDAIRALDVDILERDRLRLRAALDGNRLRVGRDFEILRGADTIAICVPTPVDDHRAPDLCALASACATIVEYARPGQLLLLTSTTYVGCTRDLLVEPLRRRGLVAGRDVAVAFSPERVDPANERFPADRVPRVVGGATASCAARARQVVAAVAADVHVVSSAEAAEMTKLYENTFRAVNVALANELASVSRVLNLDAMEVIEAAGTKPYGFMTFYPGPGVGGHCIPCDPHYLLWQLRALHHRAPLVEEAMSCIDARPAEVVRRCADVLGEQSKALRDASVHVVGVTYKPGVADMRESPALQIISGLAALGARVTYSDPNVPRITLRCGLELDQVDDPAATEADLVLVHTLHPDVDHGWIASRPIVLDATYRLGIAHCAVP
jgi:UDP-N-acetyl-D-glucosamine dehydrogenase